MLQFKKIRFVTPIQLIDSYLIIMLQKNIKKQETLQQIGSVSLLV